jgi:acyl-CoA synthetase (AMP-forming)/AMP-acid ligase II
VVVADGYDEDGVRAFLAERLARYKLPRLIIVLEALPMTAIGKLDKKLLAAMETQV